MGSLCEIIRNHLIHTTLGYAVLGIRGHISQCGYAVRMKWSNMILNIMISFKVFSILIITNTLITNITIPNFCIVNVL